MARILKTPTRSRLTVAGTKVRAAQQHDGMMFYILPTMLVLMVLVFCYTVPSPAGATQEAASTAPAKPAAKSTPKQTTEPVEESSSTTPVEEPEEEGDING